MAELSIEQQLVVRELTRGIVDGEAARYLLAVAREVFFPAGAVLHVEGDAPEAIHIILEGKVRMTREGEGDWVFDRGGVIGVLDAERGGSPHRRTAVAIFDTRAVAVRLEDWLDLLEDNLDMTIERTRRNIVDMVARGLLVPPTAGLDTQVTDPPALLDGIDFDGGLHTSERLLILRLSPVFALARTQPLLTLARQVTSRRLAPGEVLHEKGDPVDHFHIVARGRVRVHRRDPVVSAIVGAPNLVGAYAGITVESWAFGAEAVDEAVVLAIRHEALYDVMEDHFDVVRSVLAYAANARDDVQRLQRAVGGGLHQAMAARERRGRARGEGAEERGA